MPVTKAQAALKVDRHVEPKRCFITTDNGRDWRPLDGTGCAHYVAHRLNLKRGRAGSNACDEGYALRVRELVGAMAPVALKDVRIDDVWANADKTHCGLVTRVTPSENGAGTPKIEITHCSSRQGGVVTNDWASHFGGQGTFYRK